MKEMTAFNFTSQDMAEFERYAARSKALGATHVFVGQMPKSWWMWEEDFTNPYPNWSMRHCQLFKLVVPPQLEKYLPVDHAAECFKLITDRCAILEKLGLKAALRSNEPFWLPEQAYLDHPDWRGPRCDHPRRGTKPYWSPCIDNEEVLEMYSYAVKVLAEKTNIEIINFMSNDCGGGICWSNGLYPGPNGPAACRHRSMGDRMTGFINAMSDGAAAGGRGDMVIHFNADIGFKVPEYQVGMVWPRLRENQIMNTRDKNGYQPIAEVGGRDGGAVRAIPSILQMGRGMDAAAAMNRPIKFVSVSQSDLEESWVYLEEYLKNPGKGYAHVIRTAERAAAAIVGEENAGELVDIWHNVEDAVVAHSFIGLPMLGYGTLNQRLINRPFVPFPDELPPEHRDYYRKFQFQAQGEEHANDLMDIQGIETIRGFAGTFAATETLRKARMALARAIRGVNALAPKAGEAESKLRLMGDRLKVLDHFFRCISNAAQFQEVIDRTDFSATPSTDCRWPTRNDPRIEEMQNIMRDEADNANELAVLLDGRVQLLLTAENDEAYEDIFAFGPNIAEQLRLKARIMFDHINDLGRVYETHNI